MVEAVAACERWNNAAPVTVVNRMSDSPNYLRGAWSILNSLRSRRPNPTGDETVDHSGFTPVLVRLKRKGLDGLGTSSGDLTDYIAHLEAIRPDALTHDESLGYWLNLYNAGALFLAAEAQIAGLSSILRTPGVFHTDRFNIDGEHLSLDDIEHGKIRRFGDPRIHGALVCGSVSCPTLRGEPFAGDSIDSQLDGQMRAFLQGGAIAMDADRRDLSLSKVFQLYGTDFVRPGSMPSFRPVRKTAIIQALRPWIADGVVKLLEAGPFRISYQKYDWSLACAVR